MAPRKRNVQPVSFTLPFKAREALVKIRGYSLWVQALVLKNMGFCPTCQQRMPGSPTVAKILKTKEAEAPRAPGHIEQ